jgi:FkbM family methyltransferase
VADLVASVIIPAHNAANDLPRQLSALRAQDASVPFEVIVVANRCTDKTSQVAASVCDKRFQVGIVTADEKGSAAYARNVGVTVASGRRLLFCDADDEIGAGWVRGMVEALESSDYVGGVLSIEWDHVPKWLRSVYPLGREGGPGLWDERVFAPITASMGVWREAFEAVGGFDDSFVGAAGEDTDLAIRLTRAGFRCALAEEATFRYRVSGPATKLVRKRKLNARNEAVVKARYGEPWSGRTSRDEWRSLPRRYASQLVHRKRVDPRPLIAKTLFACYHAKAEQEVSLSLESEARSDSTIFDFTVPLEVPVIGGLGLQAASRRDAVSYAADRSRRGVTDVASHRCAEKLLEPGDVVVDIGANVGLFALEAALCVGSAGRVHAFEPDPVARQALMANVRRHHVDHVVDVRGEALGDSSRTRIFYSSASSILSGFFRNPYEQNGSFAEEISVVEARLDDLVDGSVAFVKMDVAGHEPDVLRGAANTLLANPAVSLLIEVNPKCLEAAGHSVDTLLALLSVNGRMLWFVDDEQPNGTGVLRPVDEVLAAVSSEGSDDWYANVLSVSSARFALIEDFIVD